MRPLRSDSFQWLAGLFCSLLGTILLVHPHQFLFNQSNSYYSLFVLIGTSLLIFGAAMLLVLVLRLSHRLFLIVNILAAIIVLLLASMLMSTRGWINSLNFLVLSTGIVLVPFLPRSTEKDDITTSGVFLHVVTGASSVLVGMLLLWPDETNTLHYNISATRSMVFGAVFFVCGLALVILNLRKNIAPPVRVRLQRIFTVALAMIYLLFPFFAGVTQQIWFAYLYYISFGLWLVLSPFIFNPGSRFQAETLYVRMAVMFSICVSLPLILISTIVARLDEIMQAFQLPANFINSQDLILAALLTILALTITIGLRLAHLFVAPLERLAAAANALAESRPDVTLPLNSRVEEVQKLSNAFLVLRKRLADRTQAWKNAQASLLQNQMQLEQRVEERTRALSLANRRLEAVLRALPVSVIITDEEGSIIRQNEIIGRGLGMDISDFKKIEDFGILDARWADSGTPVTNNEWGLARAVKYGETAWDEVMDLVLPNGETRTVVHSAAPIVDADGNIIGAVAVGQDISRQRELERISQQAARLAHQTAVQIEAIFNALTDSVIVYNSVGIVTQANSHAIALFGFDPIRLSREQIVRRLVIIDDEGKPVTTETMPSAMAQKGEAQVNKRFSLTNARGRQYKVLSSSSPVYVGSDLIGSVAIWHDITERERLMEENRRQNELLQTLIAQAPAAIAFLEGPNFRYTFYNEAYEHLARGKGPLMSRTFAEIWPEVSDQLLPLMDNVILTGKTYSAVDQPFMVLRENGLEQDYFTFNFTPIIGTEGKIEGLMILATETTEHVRIHQAIYEEQARFRGLVESITDLVCTFDKQQRFTGLYGRSVGWMNLTPEMVVGKTISEVMGKGAAPHIQAFEQVQAGSNIVYEWSFPIDSGMNHFQISLSPLWTDPARVCGAVAVVRDITEMKKARLALEKNASQLERSNRELEQFAFIASHDLQEPLRKIRSFGERVAERMQDRISEDELDYLNRMVNATHRMQRMIEDLLTFSRVTTKGQPFMMVDLNEVAEEVISDLEVRIERSAGKVDVQSLPTLQADPMQMHQLLQNLIGNALKYHRADTAPEVKVRAEIVPHNSAAGGQMLHLEISDNGIGFDEEYVDRIFQPFERLHGRSEYEGTGMGLAICRKIVERHRGSITARSKPGEGSTFIIDLPVRQPESAKTEDLD